ncbi:MAG TPA: hypothetical protein VK253_00775 [Candidatus Binatia bacterium]|nr:hypothetical protein [Candidatus Binatia bacterium]
MKPWQLNKRVNNLSSQLKDCLKTDTTIDWNCLSEPERQLIGRVIEIINQYAPTQPPQDIIEKYADLWYKALEIFGRRATELFVEVVPDSFCCDELETWYFKLYFHNFCLDWMDSIKLVRKMPKEQRKALLCERREMGMLDRVFRLPRNQPATTEKKE